MTSYRGEAGLKPAVVVSTHTMGLGVSRALSMMNVPVTAVYYDENDMGFVSRYVSEKIFAPHPEKQQNEFIELLLSLPKKDKKYQGAFLVPASDTALSALSRHKGVLSEHYSVACVDWDVAQQFLDKQYTYSLADKIGVPAPKTVTPHSMAELEAYACDIQYPCIVKPTLSHRFYAVFGKKMIIVDNFEELCRAYQRAAEQGLEVMLQEIIPGPDSSGVNYNAYIWDGEVLAEFTGQKIRSSPPHFGSPSVVLSKPVPEVLDSGRRILLAMNFNGYACTEFKYDERDESYKLIEVNGRHNLSTLLAVRCGLNFPWLHYRHQILGECPAHPTYEYDIYWIDFLRDLAAASHYMRSREITLRQFLKPYLHPHIFANLDTSDLRPFFRHVFILAGRKLKSTSKSQNSRTEAAQHAAT